MIAALPVQQELDLIVLYAGHDLAQNDADDTLTRDGGCGRMMPGCLQVSPHLQQTLALLGAQGRRPLSEQRLQLLLQRAYGREGGIPPALELASDVHPNVPDALIGDVGRLRQILLNLVGNAIKFTEEGEVVVRLKAVDAPAREMEAELHFEVRDSGIGIAPDKQETIFRAFEQGDTSTTRKYGGTGLA